MAGESAVVPVRYPAADLEIIEHAMEIMGSRNISAFSRKACIELAKAIVAAAADAGIRRSTWDQSWIEGMLERKP